MDCPGAKYFWVNRATMPVCWLAKLQESWVKDLYSTGIVCVFLGVVDKRRQDRPWSAVAERSVDTAFAFGGFRCAVAGLTTVNRG